MMKKILSAGIIVALIFLSPCFRLCGGLRRI